MLIKLGFLKLMSERMGERNARPFVPQQVNDEMKSNNVTEK